MTEKEDVVRATETTAERLEGRAKEERDRLDRQLHQSRSWLSWKRMTPGQRFGWVCGVVVLVAVIYGLWAK